MSDLQCNAISAVFQQGIIDSVEQLFDYYWKLDRESEFYDLLDRDKFLDVVKHHKSLCVNDASRGAAGSRVITGQLRQSGEGIGRYKVRSLMKISGAGEYAAENPWLQS